MKWKRRPDGARYAIGRHTNYVLRPIGRGIWTVNTIGGRSEACTLLATAKRIAEGWDKE